MDALPNATPSSRSWTHHASGTQHLDDDINELPYELQPKFTEQDERRELATLTIHGYECRGTSRRLYGIYRRLVSKIRFVRAGAA